MTTPSGIRAFIGLTIPTAVQTVLKETQLDLIGLVPEESVRWVKPINMHLTVSFLGDGIVPEQVAQLCDAIDEIAASCRPFHLELGCVGCFPRPRTPRVLWVGVVGQLRAMQFLKRVTDLALSELGWEPEERRHTPHLTLGYVQDTPAVGRARLPLNSPVSPAEWQVSKLHLFHSQRTRNGVRYPKIHTADLSLDDTSVVNR